MVHRLQRAEAGSFSDSGYKGHIPSNRSWTLLLSGTEEFSYPDSPGRWCQPVFNPDPQGPTGLHSCRAGIFFTISTH